MTTINIKFIYSITTLIGLTCKEVLEDERKNNLLKALIKDFKYFSDKIFYPSICEKRVILNFKPLQQG